MHIIEEKVCQTEIATGEESLSNSKLKVVIYGGMALVNESEIGKDVKTC